MGILVQFVYRLGLGLALGMAITSSREVDNGYFRAHSWVLLGLAVLASAVTASAAGLGSIWTPIAAAVASYASGVCWIYGRPRAGKVALLLIALLNLVGASGAYAVEETSHVGPAAAVVDVFSSGMLLGVTMAAMLLGHWYLNNPGMRLAPLRRLVIVIGVAVAVRSVVVGLGLAAWVDSGAAPATVDLALLAIRWLAGLLGTAGAAVLVWYTLKVPNTQSATGILYVAVITTFLGELSGQLLSATSGFPL
ncbi:MAG: hypothetical protein R3C10_12620 [Pirellulales bacterium]